MARIAVVLNTSWNIHNFRLPLMQHLAGLGHDVIAIAPRDEYSSRIPFEYHELPFSSKSVNPVENLKQLLRFVKVFRKARPDIALLYTIKPNTYGNIAARLNGIKTISNVAGLGNLFIEKRLATRVAQWLYRKGLKHPARVFFQNETDMEMFVSNGLVERQVAERIPGSGVDLERFKPAGNTRKPGEPFVFLMACRMLWEKGAGEFVEAARQVLTERHEVFFKLAGPLSVDNPTAISEQEMHSLISADGIEYLGVSDEIEKELGKADCFVLPSYREGLSKVLLEAAAMARPIITTRVPGCMDVVEHGVNGLLCEPQDASGLAEQMRLMLDMSTEQREAMGRRGRARVEKNFDQNLVIERYARAIDEIELRA